jgi:hypothetical protein
MPLQPEWERADVELFANCDVDRYINELRVQHKDTHWCKGPTGAFTEHDKVPVDRFLRAVHRLASEIPALEFRIGRIDISGLDVLIIRGYTLRDKVLPVHRFKSFELYLPEDLSYCIPPIRREMFENTFDIGTKKFLAKLSQVY